MTKSAFGDTKYLIPDSEYVVALLKFVIVCPVRVTPAAAPSVSLTHSA